MVGVRARRCEEEGLGYLVGHVWVEGLNSC